MPRVNAWSSFGDEDTPQSNEPPAVIRLDPAGPPAVQQRTRDASVYLTRDNPLTFVTEESDAERIASTSRWLTVDAVGVEEIKEKYGDEADRLIPSTYEARSDIDKSAEDAPNTDAESASEGPYTRTQLEDMDWPELRQRAVDSEREDINGQTSKDEIIDVLSSDSPDADSTSTRE